MGDSSKLKKVRLLIKGYEGEPSGQKVVEKLSEIAELSAKERALVPIQKLHEAIKFSRLGVSKPKLAKRRDIGAGPIPKRGGGRRRGR